MVGKAIVERMGIICACVHEKKVVFVRRSKR